MEKWNLQVRNACVALFCLISATLINLFVGGHMGNIPGSSANTKMVFLLAVLLTTRYTTGYFWGILSAVIAVLADNYLFTYPYTDFNLSISGYLLTFVTMLAVALVVSVLTSRVREQEKLRLFAEKEKMRANLLRAVSHDLRTPLTSIVGATGAILENNLPAEKQRELLSDVNGDAQWLLRMIENLLTITRMNDTTRPLHTETEVVEDVLGEAVIKFQKHFKGISVEMDMGSDVLLADMDAVLVEQVTINLLENAVYHGKHTTRICVNARQQGEKVTITIADNGAGIPKEKLEKIFVGEAVHEAGADSHKHMGIGLSVCKTIIKAHGGLMTAFNNEYGGASFSFTLPAKENEYGFENPDC